MRVVEQISASGAALARIAEHEETLLTLDEVKTRLGLKTDEAVLKLVKTGGLPMFKVGREWRITRKAYRAAMQRSFASPKRATRKNAIGQ